jgi:hypothetical protein
VIAFLTQGNFLETYYLISLAHLLCSGRAKDSLPTEFGLHGVGRQIYYGLNHQANSRDLWESGYIRFMPNAKNNLHIKSIAILRFASATNIKFVVIYQGTTSIVKCVGCFGVNAPANIHSIRL